MRRLFFGIFLGFSTYSSYATNPEQSSPQEAQVARLEQWVEKIHLLLALSPRALIHAVQGANWETVSYLLAHRASAKIVLENGENLLHAVLHSKEPAVPEIFKLLLEHGADPMHHTTGVPLWHAICKMPVAVHKRTLLAMLHERNVDMSGKDKDGSDALMMLASCKDPKDSEAAQFLLSQKIVDVNLQNVRHATALSMGLVADNLEFVRTVLEFEPTVERYVGYPEGSPACTNEEGKYGVALILDVALFKAGDETVKLVLAKLPIKETTDSFGRKELNIPGYAPPKELKERYKKLLKQVGAHSR